MQRLVDRHERSSRVKVPQRCPHCADKYRGILIYRELGFLEEVCAMNKLSRRDNKTYVCRACGLAEQLADHTEITDEMARRVVENDRQEALRMSAGSFHGVSNYPTGGLDEDMARREAYDNAKRVR